MLELREAPVDPSSVPPRVVSPSKQAGCHHRGEGQGDDAGDQHGAGKCEREFTEEGSGKAALDSDRRVDSREGDRHGDDGPQKFAPASQRGMDRREAGMEMALDVFYHDDRVIHDETDGKNDGKKRQEIHGEAEHGHDESGADQ